MIPGLCEDVIGEIFRFLSRKDVLVFRLLSKGTKSQVEGDIFWRDRIVDMLPYPLEDLDLTTLKTKMWEKTSGKLKNVSYFSILLKFFPVAKKTREKIEANQMKSKNPPKFALAHFRLSENARKGNNPVYGRPMACYLLKKGSLFSKSVYLPAVLKISEEKFEAFKYKKGKGKFTGGAGEKLWSYPVVKGIEFWDDSPRTHSDSYVETPSLRIFFPKKKTLLIVFTNEIYDSYRSLCKNLFSIGATFRGYYLEKKELSKMKKNERFDALHFRKWEGREVATFFKICGVSEKKASKIHCTGENLDWNKIEKHQKAGIFETGEIERIKRCLTILPLGLHGKHVRNILAFEKKFQSSSVRNHGFSFDMLLKKKLGSPFPISNLVATLTDPVLFKKIFFDCSEVNCRSRIRFSIGLCQKFYCDSKKKMKKNKLLHSFLYHPKDWRDTGYMGKFRSKLRGQKLNSDVVVSPIFVFNNFALDWNPLSLVYPRLFGSFNFLGTDTLGMLRSKNDIDLAFRRIAEICVKYNCDYFYGNGNTSHERNSMNFVDEILNVFPPFFDKGEKIGFRFLFHNIRKFGHSKTELKVSPSFVQYFTRRKVEKVVERIGKSRIVQFTSHEDLDDFAREISKNCFELTEMFMSEWSSLKMLDRAYWILFIKYRDEKKFLQPSTPSASDLISEFPTGCPFKDPRETMGYIV